MKLAIITCYFDPDYVRARSLRAALASLPEVELIELKNSHKGILRYPEMMFQLLKLRVTAKPDVYLLTFRGQELLPWLLLIAGHKPVIFDEFILPLAWTLEKGRSRSAANTVKKFLARLSAPLYKVWLRRCRFILEDTDVHAAVAAELSGLPRDRYVTVPVGTDEVVFKPSAKAKRGEAFTVFYYGNMLPLHGLSYVLEAAVALKDYDIEFVIIGGDKATLRAVYETAQQGARISHQLWIPFERLPDAIHAADLCLGGPFGNTAQAQRVITGKTYQFLASAAPVLIGRNSATEQYFTDKKDCLLVGQGDADALQTAILWAYKNRAKLPAIGLAGHDTYEQHFAGKVIARLLQAMLQKLA